MDIVVGSALVTIVGYEHYVVHPRSRIGLADILHYLVYDILCLDSAADGKAARRYRQPHILLPVIVAVHGLAIIHHTDEVIQHCCCRAAL